jgi:hypothetical protein
MRRDFQRAYIGETERSLNVMCKEHVRSFRKNKKDPVFGMHILNNRQQCGNV